MHHPRPAGLAKQILDSRDRRYFRAVLPHVVAMASLDALGDESGYEVVATVRRGLVRWRTTAAREIKYHLDTLLTQYRADKWQRHS